MISKVKSNPKKRGDSQQKKKKTNILSKSPITENIIPIKKSLINTIPKNLRKFFIYKLYSLDLFINNSDFREIFLKGKFNYEKQITFFKTQSRIFQNLNKKNLEDKDNSKDKIKKFICTGGYKDICNALKQRGWIQLKETRVDDVNFLWTLKTIEVNFSKLKNFQLANHFQKAFALTRKSGLCKNIRNLFYKGINPDNFYPRCYDLSISNDLNNFLYDFKITKAISILIKFTLENNQEKIPEIIINTCLNIINSNLKVITCDYRNIDEGKNDVNNENNKNEDSNNIYKLISDDEWNIISGEDNIIKNNNGILFNNLKIPSIQPINKISPNINSEIAFPQLQNNLRSKNKLLTKIKSIRNPTKQTKRYLKKLNKENMKKHNNSVEKYTKDDPNFNIKNYIKINRNNTLEKSQINNNISHIQTEEKTQKNVQKLVSKEKYKTIISNLLKKLKKFLPQFSLNGYHNIWIIKPSNLSRGRSIQCINSLNQINNISSNLNNYFVIQKYIENPMIIYKRKFDIRQWVLVTHLNPLTLWMWEEPYLRFSAEDYDIDNFSNIYSHLTNNSIAKYSEKYKSESLIKEDMWELDYFKKYLKENYNKENIWDEIYEKMKNAIICSFDSGKHEIVYRENCFELYGYDFMIDNEFNVFLIEINSSPAMDYSTSITEKLVQEMSENLIQIVIDKRETCRDFERIGKFIKVYDGKEEISEKFIPNKNLLY